MGWFTRGIFYEIFPDRFFNGDMSNDPEITRNWGEKPSKSSFFGGDLSGIIKKLDYLQFLGISALYLTPIFRAPSTHKYDTEDYMEIDPNFGSMEKFEELLKKAHKRGIKIILDGVFNHTGDKFWAFVDAEQYGQKSRYWDWYKFHDFPIRKHPIPNYEHAGIVYLPKLNHQNSQVMLYITKVIRFWTNKGIDGWRFDMSWCIEPSFWKYITQIALEINPELFFIGEYWGNPKKFLSMYPFHSATDYMFREMTLQLLNAKLSSADYLDHLSYKFGNSDSIKFCWNMLGSHDTPRLLGQLHRNIRKAIVAFTLQFTMPGLPLIYYGDEIGLFGGKDPDCRQTFIWNEDRWNTSILESVRNLIEFRKHHPALSTGQFRIIDVEADGFSYERYTETESVQVDIDLKAYMVSLLKKPT